MRERVREERERERNSERDRERERYIDIGRDGERVGRRESECECE